MWITQIAESFRRKLAVEMNGVFVAALLCFCTVVYIPSVELISSDLLTYDYGLCNTATYAANSSFADNLNTVYGLVSRYSSTSLFHNATVISNPNSTSDNVYGFFQCRGDLSLADCSSCIFSIVNSAVCSSAVGSRVQLQGCFLRYENYNFFLQPDHAFITSNCSANSSTATASYRENLASVLNATAKAAASALGGFDSSSRGSGDNTAYALAQCLAYLSPSQCATCLQVSNYNTLCPNAVAGTAFYSTCYYLYSEVSFNSTLTSTAPTPGTVAPPPVQNTPPPLAPSISPVGGKINTPLEIREAGSKRAAIVGAVVGAILFVVLCSLVLFCIGRRRKSSRHGSEIQTDGISKLQNVPAYNARNFSLSELRKATNNFHAGNKLGEGGFGPVYKGRLPNEKEVAVKMLSMKSHQGTKQFLNEVSLITTVQHRNLVELLGYCVGHSKRILVYEYLPNRSLDVHLFGQGEAGGEETISLNWRARYDMIVGIARGLQYLHEDSHVKIVHRDIKPSNILLDNNLHPKIADFGLARLFHDNDTHFTTRVAGTMGYLSPEYAIGGQLTEKVDVYSFGLVALEILSGRRIMDERLEPEKQQLLEWTWTLYEKRQQLQILDPKLVGQPVDPGEVIRMVHVALLCTQTSARARPAMSKVFAMLCGQSEILELPTKPLLIDIAFTQGHLVPSLSSSSESADPSHLPVSNTGSRPSRYAADGVRKD